MNLLDVSFSNPKGNVSQALTDRGSKYLLRYSKDPFLPPFSAILMNQGKFLEKLLWAFARIPLESALNDSSGPEFQ